MAYNFPSNPNVNDTTADGRFIYVGNGVWEPVASDNTPQTLVGDRVLPVSDTGASGDSTRASREDHVHQLRISNDLNFTTNKTLEFSETSEARIKKGEDAAKEIPSLKTRLNTAETSISDEKQNRIDGDDLQSITIGSLSNYNAAISAQATSDEPLELVFSTTVVLNPGTAQEVTYNVGDVVYYAPRSTSPERRFNVVSHTELAAEATKRQLGDQIDVYEGVTSDAELTAAITRHTRSTDRAGLIVIAGDFSTYKTGQRYYIAPHHNAAGDLKLLSEAGGGGSGEDTTARAAASAAQKLANENKTRIDAIPKYAAIMTVNPPNVASHSAVQRSFQSTLSSLDDNLATNAGSTGTRFTNVFRIFTRDGDGDIVQLHTQGWSFTNDARQSISWSVSAAEFNQLGTDSTTTGLEVWGEFRAVYGGGVNEPRGRTNSVFIDFGNEDSWPATRGELAIVSNERFQLLPRQEIALLNLRMDPSTITFTTANELRDALRATRLEAENAELLTSDAWVEVSISGQSARARTKWTGTTNVLALTLSQSVATTVSNNSFNSDKIDVGIVFYDAASGGNALESLILHIDLVKLPGAFDPNTIDGISGGDVTEIDNSRLSGFNGLKVWVGTEAQFDALPTKTVDTIYFRT